MALARQWVKTDNGEYLVLSGTKGAVLQENKDSRHAAFGAWIFGWLWLLFSWYARTHGRGRVEVRWRDEAWAWETADEYVAYTVAKRIEGLITSGAWIPMRTPQPDVAGAEAVLLDR